MDMEIGGMGGIEMGDMDMGNGVPQPYSLQKAYWSFIGAAIGVATIVHVFERMVCWQRIHAARNGMSAPARPKSILMILVATTTAISREAIHATLLPGLLLRLGVQLPTAGAFLLSVTQLAIVLTLCFVDLDPTQSWNWENLAYRTGYLATAQLPLIFVLSGKINIVGFLTGIGYEKLNWLHRWTARLLFLTTTLHMIFWLEDWAQYDYIVAQLQNDRTTQRGFAAWAILLWIFLSSFRPIRWLSHEFFVVQHIVTVAGFSALVYLHLPSDMKYVLWISVAFAIFDRGARSVNVMLQNISFSNSDGRVLGYRARLEKLPGNVTRITVDRPKFSWRPGQHVLMACHSIAPLQSHPFTIASLPSDDKLVFLVKARRGGTLQIHRNADQSLPLVERGQADRTVLTTVEGPYGQIRPLQQFDSVVLLAGSTGATFTMPLMRDLIQRCTGKSATKNRMPLLYDGCVTNHIKFVWIIKSESHLLWLVEEINTAMSLIEECPKEHAIEMSVSVYVTCDETLQGLTSFSSDRSPSASTATVNETDKRTAFVTVAEERLEPSVDTRRPESREYCGPDSTCCCTSIVEEGERDSQQCKCACEGSEEDAKVTVIAGDALRDARSVSEFSISTSITEKPLTAANSASRMQSQIRLHPSVNLLYGRPNVRSIIRRSLEQALGESAVVTCGPDGLIADVRASVVALSDERAVHKGTGAQGIYLHTECFSF